jgi:hypothetical protein
MPGDQRKSRAGSRVAKAVTHYTEVLEFTHPRISAAPRARSFRQNRPADAVVRASRNRAADRIYNVREALDSDHGAAPNSSDAYRGANH